MSPRGMLEPPSGGPADGWRLTLLPNLRGADNFIVCPLHYSESLRASQKRR